MAHQGSQGNRQQGVSGRLYSPLPLGVLGHPFFLVREEAKCFHSGYSWGPDAYLWQAGLHFFYFYF